MTWANVKLSDVAKIERNGVDPASIEPGTSYLGLEHIESGGRILGAQTVANGELASTKFRFSSDHILYGKLRPYLAKIALPDFSGICSTDILPVKPGPRVDKRYLAYFFRQPSMVDFANGRSSGANLPRLSPKALADFEIPLPPLDEQKRIAAILDQADGLRYLRQRAIDRLNSLGQAIFHEMFGETIEATSIQDLLKNEYLLLHKDGNHGGNYPSKEEFGEQGVPFLSAKCVDDFGSFIDSELQFLNEEKANSLRIGWIKEGDVLLSHNASVGKVAAYRGEYGEALIGTSLTCFRPNPDKLKSDFLAYALQSYEFQSQLTQNMSQTTRNQVPITAQKRLLLSIPPISDQIEFDHRVSSAVSMRSKMFATAEQTETLFSSLQNRAFRGEL